MFSLSLFFSFFFLEKKRRRVWAALSRKVGKFVRSIEEKLFHADQPIDCPLTLRVYDLVRGFRGRRGYTRKPCEVADICARSAVTLFMIFFWCPTNVMPREVSS